MIPGSAGASWLGKKGLEMLFKGAGYTVAPWLQPVVMGLTAASSKEGLEGLLRLLGLGADPEKIIPTDKYGFTREAAGDYKKKLKEKTDKGLDAETLLSNIAMSYASALTPKMEMIDTGKVDPKTGKIIKEYAFTEPKLSWEDIKEYGWKPAKREDVGFFGKDVGGIEGLKSALNINDVDEEIYPNRYQDDSYIVDKEFSDEDEPFERPKWEKGGLIPRYYGGGSVQGTPTISDYFLMQGKTLGGSDKQSLAERLGRS